MKKDKFDPSRHRLSENRWFEDFVIGETFPIPSRTMTDALFAAFQLASGDNHPIHYDAEYCKTRGYKGLLAHGMQVFIQTAAGAGMFPHVVDDSMVAFSEASCRFLKPVFAGDTVYPNLEVIGLEPQNSTGVLTMSATVHNQDGVLVMQGEHKYIIKKRPA
ncbi:MAG: MaoC family dehydratase [Gammaproteobacteria bacterium]|nr:MaoC family dehydratase [Gammaproteobacteria bacterium]